MNAETKHTESLLVMNLHADKRQDRLGILTQAEWVQAVQKFDQKVRYHAANLAAHNWDVFKIGDRLLVTCCWSGGDWWTKDGDRHPLSDADYNRLYPETDRRSNEASRGRDGKLRLLKVDKEALEAIARAALLKAGG